MTIEQYPSSNNIASTVIWKYTSQGTETVLSGTDSYGQVLNFTPGSEQLFLNGVLLVRTQDYTPAANGLSITLPSQLAYGDFVQIYCYSNYSISTVASSAITGSVQNTQLTNSIITIGNQAIALGQTITIPTGLTLSGATNTFSNIPNSALTNSTIIVNGNPISLGASVNITTPNTILSQKGGLIVGTGGGSVTQLASGVNGQFLLSDSSKTSGLNYGGPVNIAGKNIILNGNFDFASKGYTTYALTGGQVATSGFDRWYLYSLGSATSTYSLQQFALGEIPGYEPKNYLRCITTSVGSVGDAVLIQNQIDNVRTLASGTATISFWARAASGTPKIGIDTEQVYGAGSVTTIEWGSVTLSTAWQRYTLTTTIPSLSVGSIQYDGQDHINVGIWYSAGTSWGTRPSGVGLQNNTFDIALIQLESGSTATGFSKSGGNLNLEAASIGSGIIDGVLTSNKQYYGGTLAGVNGWAGYNVAGKNKIQNGAMEIDQRNSGVAVTATSNAYPVDRFKFISNAGDTTVQQVNSVYPVGFSNSLKIQTSATKTPSGSTYAAILHYVEGYNMNGSYFGSTKAVPMTLSFWVNASKIGTYSLSFKNNGASYTLVKEYTILTANNWEYKTITIPGCELGTWATTTEKGIDIAWWLAGTNTASSTKDIWVNSNQNMSTSQVNLYDAIGATFYLTGVQFEIGPTATQFTRSAMDINSELQKCQRYFVALPYNNGTARVNQYADFLAMNAVDQTTWARGVYHTPVPMRTVPTLEVTPTAANYYLLGSGGVLSLTSISLDTETTASTVVINAYRAVTTGASYFLRFAGNTTDVLKLTAEMN